MIWNNIPDELKDEGLWCCWRLTEKGKQPFDPVSGNMARSNDPSTFHTFKTALEHLHNYYSFDEQGNATGGLGLGVFRGFSAIDIDHCIDDDGVMNDMAKDIVDYCQSYTEISPSGKGIRIIIKTDTELNKETHYVNNRKIGLEIYLSDQTNKYVTITGNVLYSSKIATIDIRYILEKYMKKETYESVMRTEQKTDITFDINNYTSDSKLQSLWYGVAPGSGANESELDLALVSKISFYLQGDLEKVNEAFMSSPYYTSKDPEHKRKWEVRSDYRNRTLRQSLKTLSTVSTTPDKLTLTDTGNAHRFVQMFGDKIRFNVDNKRWMFWNGKNWQTDVYGNIKNYAEVVIERMRLQAKSENDEDTRKAMLQNVRRALQSSGKVAMIKESEHVEGIPVTNDDFDQNPFLFNTGTGVVDLKTGDIEPHSKDLMLSRYTPYEVKVGTPKRWLEFLGEVFEHDSDMIKYVQRIMGYSMTGSTKEQVMFMLIGDGSNGKSLMLEIMNEALGSYGATSNVEILLEKKSGGGENRGEIARLAGVRHVVTDEAKLGDKLNESAIKTLTSGIGKIVARFLYGNEFEFTPIFKIFMASNYKPTIRGTDHGIWRRIKVVPFKVVIPDEKQDKDLKAKLIREMPQILNWMIEGAIEWQRIGLASPKKIEKETNEYRSEMDVVQRWLEETCMFDSEYRESSSELFKNFSNYVQTNKEYQLSHTMFGRNLSKKFQKRVYGGTTYYVGLKLKADNEYRYDPKVYDEI